MPAASSSTCAALSKQPSINGSFTTSSTSASLSPGSEEYMKGPSFFIFFLLISIGMVFGTLFTPAMPEVGRYFGVSKAAVIATITLFLAGYTVGMLPYGPIANRWGRKMAIYIGLALAFIGSVISLFSHAFWIFCLGRFIQAMGC